VIPLATNSCTHAANGLEHGTSGNGAVVHAGGVKAAPSRVFSRKTAICSRVTGFVGQYRPPPQLAVIPRATSSCTHTANGLAQGTSGNGAVVHGGGA
jgi:hypothetical protein